MSIEDRVRKVVSEQLDVSSEIDNNASFIDDLGADSLDTVELVMSLEEEFDCEIAVDKASIVLEES
ncbi:acyl carrier protein [Candidatus Pseudothioglobus singularis]|nr:acyl carrier protein [Candidatus Pseudothioglobus singularis]